MEGKTSKKQREKIVSEGAYFMDMLQRIDIKMQFFLLRRIDVNKHELPHFSDS